VQRRSQRGGNRGNLETTLSHWADACHAQGGTVIIPHLPNPNAEPAALIATGGLTRLRCSRTMTISMWSITATSMRLQAATGGRTDKMSSDVRWRESNVRVHPPDEEFNYDNWVRTCGWGARFLAVAR